MSWSTDPDCKLVDVLAARPWNSSRCPHCERSHRETSFYSPPSGLQDRVVWRARSVGARGLFLVPCNTKAPFYVALKKHAVATMDVPNEPDVFIHKLNPLCKHTLLAVDVGLTDGCTAGCGQDNAHLPQGRFVFPVEAEESNALLFKMFNLAAEFQQRQAALPRSQDTISKLLRSRSTTTTFTAGGLYLGGTAPGQSALPVPPSSASQPLLGGAGARLSLPLDLGPGRFTVRTAWVLPKMR